MSEHELRPTDAPFGPEESQTIIAALRRGEHPPCPRCGGPLESPPVSATNSSFQLSLCRCPTCRRAVFHGEYLRRPAT